AVCGAPAPGGHAPPHKCYRRPAARAPLLCPQVCLTRRQHATGCTSILTEETSPISLDERALSSGALGQLAVDRAAKAGGSRAHNTRRNSQTRCAVFWTACPAAPAARVIGSAGHSYTNWPLWRSGGVRRVCERM